jgi:heterodisulfide reductase subunit B
MKDEYKRTRGCAFCKENEPACLDFHHVSGKKENLVSKLVNSRNKFLKEAAKCIVVCSNCHRKIHAGILPAGVEPA